MSLLVLLAFASNASGAPKQIVNRIGSPEPLETGGLFRTPGGIAVNQTGAGGVPAGTFYVADPENGRIQRFGPTGAFVSTWGFGVRAGNPEFEICTVASECGRDNDQSEGTEGAAGKLYEPMAIAVDQSNGNVFVADRGAAARRIDVFAAGGAFEGAFGFGVIQGEFGSQLEFCTSNTGCRRPSFFASTQGGAFPGAIGGLAVDPAGNVYVADGGNGRVDVFKPTLSGATVTGVEFLDAFGWGVDTGASAFEVCTAAANCKAGVPGSGLGQFASESPTDVVIDSEGHVFALDAGNNRIEQFTSAPAPVTATFGSTALAAVFGSGAKLFNLAIDPSTTPNHLLVSGSRLGAGGKVAVAELDGSGNNVLGAGIAHGEDLPITSANGLAAASASIGGSLYVSTVTVGILRGAYVLNEAPTIEPVTNITGTTATFNGKVVSRGIDVKYHFEYSTDGKTWVDASSSDLDAGTSAGIIDVSTDVTGLTGSQPYRVRLVQNRPLGGGEATSAETTFTTEPARPAIQGTVASPIGDTSATFNAYINPQNQTTDYRFEYGPADCSANPCIALPVSQASGGGLRLVTQTLTGLQPATSYHYRLVVTNASGVTSGADRSFETSAPGAALPDDRAYELVTPPDTGAVVLAGTALGGSGCADTLPATADGNSVVSASKGGALPGLDVNGRLDLYESIRGPNGWVTVSDSASGAQTDNPQDGLCVSPDHLYSTLVTGTAPGDKGSLAAPGGNSNYVREPDGTFSLVGQGSLGVDRGGKARLITEKADHIIFSSNVHLEPGAAPTNTESIYDRSPNGPTRVVSLLPGDVSLPLGQNASYQGASKDGSAVAFKLSNGRMYARLDNSTTIAAPDVVSGQGLTCTGGPNGTTLTYEWLRNGAPIGGATASTYTPVAADEGTVLQCLVKAASAEGASLKASGPMMVGPVPGPPPPNPGTPGITGTANVGQTLTCNPGSWENTSTFSYQWRSNGAPATGLGANTSTYTVAAADKGAAVQCGVTGASPGGAAIAYSVPKLIEAKPPTASANPAVTGTPSLGNSLSCSNGTWTNSPTFSYQWLRNGASIGGATTNTYTVTAEDEGKVLQCRVTAANGDGSTQAVSARVVASPAPATTPPSLTSAGGVTGTAQVGKSLTCANGTWATPTPTFTRQWLRNGSPIGGATGTSYTLVSADRGTVVQCEVKATNAGGSVVAINASATGARYISPAPPTATAVTPSTVKTFAGLSDDGNHLFYQEAAGVYDLNTSVAATTLITGAANAQLVNISGDGSHVYFISTTPLTGGEENDRHQAAEAGKNNVYAWNSASRAVHFVAIVAQNDINLNPSLTRWTSHATNPSHSLVVGRANDSSRTTPDGSILLFESRADVTGYDSGGHIEIYRYDDGSGDLSCVSCPATGVPAFGDARLQMPLGTPFLATSAEVDIRNVTNDGQEVFFQTEDALAPGDVNGTWDVYEWKAGQQAYLISSGHGQLPSFLYATTPTGRDVFFTSTERLVPQDLSTVFSIYDARIGGGFPIPEFPPPCQEDNCQGGAAAAPQLANPGSASFQGPSKERPLLHCGKAKRRVKRHGHLRCVKRHRHHAPKRHRRANHNRGGVK